MKLKQLMLAPVALGMVAPAAMAADLNMNGVNQYSLSEQVTSINQLSDVQPTDWAYQALSNLVERYGCVAGYANGTYGGGRAMTRYEAMNLLLFRVLLLNWKHRLDNLKQPSSPPLPNCVVKQTLFLVVFLVMIPKVEIALALHSTTIFA